MNAPAVLLFAAALACMVTAAPALELHSSRRSISYHTMDVEGLGIFYREAGPTTAPAVLLLQALSQIF